MANIQVTKDLDNKKLVIKFLASGSLENAWHAYADKASFEQWWGPQGWETTATEFSFTVGGRIHYGMKCIDQNQAEWFGQTSWGVMEIESIEDGRSFTYKDYFSDEAGTLNTGMPVLTITNDFVEEDGKTWITSTSYAGSAEQIEQLINMGMVEGFSSQLEKLDALLSSAAN